MPKVDLICAVCGHSFQLDSGNLKFLAKHCAGAPLCSRACVNVAELAADARRPAVRMPFEHLMACGPGAPSRRQVRSQVRRV